MSRLHRLKAEKSYFQEIVFRRPNAIIVTRVVLVGLPHEKRSNFWHICRKSRLCSSAVKSHLCIFTSKQTFFVSVDYCSQMLLCAISIQILVNDLFCFWGVQPLWQT